MADTITEPPKPNPAATKLVVSCGDCVFHTNTRLPTATSTCSGMGCPPSRAPCVKFTPNVFSDAVGATLASKDLRKALNAVPEAAVASVAMALAQVGRLRAVGLGLGQIVYFNAVGKSAGRDYVANYYRGRVMLLDKQGNVLIKGVGVSATINLDSVLTEDAWQKKRAKLLANKAIFDPKSPFTWERKDSNILTKKKYRPAWLDKEVAKYRASYFEAKATRQTHDYDDQPVKRGRGRPKGSSKVKTYDVSAAA